MIRKTSLRFGLILLILCAASVGGAAVDRLTDVVPTNAPVVFYVEDVPTTMKQWEDSPLARLLDDPQVKAFFAPLREDLEIDQWDELARKETGYGIDEIKKMFVGDLAVFVEDLDLDLTSGSEDFDINVAMLVKIGDNAGEFEKLMVTIEEKTAAGDDDEDGETTREIREFRGIDLHVASTFSNDELTEETGWAVVDGVWAFASPLGALERAVAGILDGGVEDSLRSGDNFGTISRHTAKADGWFFVDMDPWVPMLRTAIEQGAAAAQEGGSPFPIDPDLLMEALGVEAMQAFFATFDFAGKATAMDFGATYTENRGLIKLIAYGPKTAPRSTFIPGDSDSFTTAYFDFAASWSALVDIVNGINPALMGMAAMQLQSMTQNSGVELDLKRDLLDNLTGEMASIQNFEGISGETIADLELQQDQVFVLGIQQKEALESTIEAMKGMVGQGSEFFSDRDFEGHTIFTLDLPRAEGEEPGNEVAYVITDSNLLISMGSPATLEKVLLKMGAKGEPVWMRPNVRKALGHLPDGAAAVQYQDLPSVGDLIFHAIAIAETAKTGDGEDVRLCDPSAKPDPGIIGKYFSAGVSGVWKDDRSLVVRSRVLAAEGN